MATEFTPLHEVRCARCGARYEVRLFRQVGGMLEIDAACPVCPRDAIAAPTFTVPKND